MSGRVLPQVEGVGRVLGGAKYAWYNGAAVPSGGRNLAEHIESNK